MDIQATARQAAPGAAIINNALPCQLPKVPCKANASDARTPDPQPALHDRGNTAGKAVRSQRTHLVFATGSGSASGRNKLKFAGTGTILLLAVALAGCGTPPAKNFSSPWIAVNRFRSAPAEIPLNPAYLYYASPMDETLKTMLTRWAKDSGRELAYQLPFDVTLYQPVASIRTADIDDAVAQLNTIYAAQGVSVTANPRRIEVGPTTTAANTAGGNDATKVATPATPVSKP